MKSTIKQWAATNLMELSTWVGLIILFRELLSGRASTLMVVLGLVLVATSEAKLNAFIQARAPSLKKWIESL